MNRALLYLHVGAVVTLPCCRPDQDIGSPDRNTGASELPGPSATLTASAAQVFADGFMRQPPSGATARLASAEALAIQRKPAARSLLRLPADRCESASALPDFASDVLRAQAPGGLIGLLEQLLCTLEVLGTTAGDERAGPA